MSKKREKLPLLLAGIVTFGAVSVVVIHHPERPTPKQIVEKDLLATADADLEEMRERFQRHIKVD